MSKRVKKSNVLKQHQEPEDWCFECKDGGEVVVCDHGGCGKVYHPRCIDQDDSLSEVKTWVCGWHYCITCRDIAKYYCLGCANGSLCYNCLDASKFTVIRKRKGLCSVCSQLVLIIEQKLDQDSEGNKLSLNDRETYECLFKEYWEIIKDNEKLTSNDVLAALDNSKKDKSVLSQSDYSEDGEEEEEEELLSSDSDEDHTRKRKTIRRKKPNGKESRLSKSGSWGKSILDSYRKGKSFLPQSDSNEDGEKEEELISSDSDEDRSPKRKTIQRKKPNGKESRLSKSGSWGKSILDSYRKGKSFLPQSNSNEDGEKKEELISSDSDEDRTPKLKTIQRKRPNGKESKPSKSKSSSRGKSLLKKGLLYLKPSYYASINARNINLIYLKQSLVQELSKQPESFTNKVVGAFVRVKVDTNDPRQRSSYHLVKVIGVLNDEISNGFLFQVSSMPNAIPISKISDIDFIEEEIVDLQKQVKSGLLPRFTITEIQEKANLLHEDITKHRIATRLVYLQNQIDRANLRGRHREKDEFINEREELAKKSKQEELLRKLPSVSAELIEANYDSEEDKEETDKESQ